MNRLDNKEVKSRLKMYNPKLKIKNIERYKNMKSKLNFICECGHEYVSNLDSVLSSVRRNGCMKCQKRKKSKRKYSLSHKTYISRVNDVWGDDIQIMSKYINGDSKIKAKCNVCLFEWETSARIITRGHGCPKCGHDRTKASRVKSDEVFKSELSNIHRGRISTSDVYVNSYTKLEFNCVACSNVWLAQPAMILRGRGCPICNLSKGELLISEILEELCINYKEQFIIDGLKTDKGGTPRFDFAIFDEDDRLYMIIEFDGIHHYKPIKRYGGIKRLNEQMDVDMFKDSYCKSNDIIMARIPYTEFKKIDIGYMKSILRYK